MELTIKEFFDGEYLRLRTRSKEFAVADDVSRIKNHYLGTFGLQQLERAATDDGMREHIEWLSELPARPSKRDKQPLAPNTLWNTFYSVKVLLDAAVDLKRLARHPFQPPFDPSKYLPSKGDKNPEWRESAYLEVDDVAALTSDPRLSLRRRVSNSLDLMTGGRCGEIANLRFRDVSDKFKGALGRIQLATSFNTRARKEKSTKTSVRKLVPVHPYLARILEAWHDSGWTEYMDRAPTPDDFILPRADGAQVPNWKRGEEWLADLKYLRIHRIRHHDARAVFRNLLLGRGASKFHVDLMTHPSKKGRERPVHATGDAVAGDVRRDRAARSSLLARARPARPAETVGALGATVGERGRTCREP